MTMDQGKQKSLTGALDALVQARRSALEQVRSMPHQMEPVRDVDGVAFVNDSRATFLDATLESLRGVDARVVWIAGALPADVSRGPVKEFLREKLSALALFGAELEEGFESLEPLVERVYVAEELRTAVFLARELAMDGEVVLFSPACPSGPEHANYEERGSAFRQAVRDL